MSDSAGLGGNLVLATVVDVGKIGRDDRRHFRRAITFAEILAIFFVEGAGSGLA
jgi:hypothetical protein